MAVKGNRSWERGQSKPKYQLFDKLNIGERSDNVPWEMLY